MKRLLVAAAIAVLAVQAHAATAPEYKACHAGNTTACKKWRVGACRDGNPAACDYDKVQKQSDPIEWCAQRYPNDAGQYRFGVNGSPDR